MAEESKEVDTKINAAVIEEVVKSEKVGVSNDNEIDDEEDPENTSTDAIAEGAAAKKKKSKKAKLKKALGAGRKDDPDVASSSKLTSKMTKEDVERLLEKNPSLKSEVTGMDLEKTSEALKSMNVAELLTGMVSY